MGIRHSCFSSPIHKIHTLHRRRNLSKKKKLDQAKSNIPVNVNNNNLININNATEDELLLLPGINHHLAENIIQYRQLNRGFKKLDELLLINGITYSIYERIRYDLKIDLSSEKLPSNKKKLININVATNNELCTIPDLTPILIKRIIERRERKGPFRFIEDLLKIKGMNYIILANIRSYITVDDQQISKSINESSIPEPSPTDLYPTLNKNKNNNNNATSDSLSLASLLLETLPPELQNILRSSTTQRPSSKCKNNQTYFRFASWNLQQLTNDKVQNPGVREVVCRTILEHK